MFTNATPEHWCAPQSELDALGLPEDLLKNLTIPGDQVYEECRAYTVDLIGLHDLLNDYVEERYNSYGIFGNKWVFSSRIYCFDLPLTNLS